MFPLNLRWADGGESPDHSWPFCPLSSVAVPEVKDKTWVKNPIDAFVLAELEHRKLHPRDPAGRATLIRRLTFDLHGLPPTPTEITDFLADPSPNAYEKLVDRLLASPRFGERWARHWLDVVRYADTAGFKTDFIRGQIYRYRDYVIDAFNDDLALDSFVSQQIAGDELEANNPAALVATGMLRLYAEEVTASDFVKLRQDVLDDVTEVTGLAFLGLTLGCAKCHDHKFDPLTQVDFFRWEACFAGVVPRDDTPMMSCEKYEEYAEKLQLWQTATAEIRANIAALVEPVRKQALLDAIMPYDHVTQTAWNTHVSLRSTLQKQLLALSGRQVFKRMDKREQRLEGDSKHQYEVLQQELAAFDAIKPLPPETAMSIESGAGPAPSVYVLASGDYRKPKEEVAAGVPEFLGNPQCSQGEFELGSPAAQRRAELAKWLTASDHPLTKRVMVNRLWHHHFGRGIVNSPNDFGAMGAGPTHANLLDWLARELAARGGSLKDLHRLMVLSNTYRQSSVVDLTVESTRQALTKDSDNQWLWRSQRRRLEAEAVRDSLLQLAGRLNTRMHGPAGLPVLPDIVVQTSAYAWDPDEVEADRYRRTIYSLQKRNLRLPLLAAFDQPDMYNSCGSRARTITTSQALSLWNGELVAELARYWAGRLLAETEDDASLIRLAYQQAFGRVPNDEELLRAQEFLDAQSQLVAADASGAGETSSPLPCPSGVSPERGIAIVDFCHALMNSSELLFVD